MNLPDDLLLPENYPPPTPSRIEFRSTHISWVFLTEGEAWKVKRPVTYGFLDYGTLEARKRFCEEEVRLNRRLAPAVYRGVEPVRRDARGHSFSRGGDVVDYAVRMVRLPDEASAGAMLAAGRLGSARLDALAERLVPFYRGAARDSSAGALEALRTTLEENYSSVEPHVGRLLDRGTFETVRARQREFLTRERALLQARVDAGFIREGHGDLRLEHVYFLQDEPVVIDCIEFNPKLRFGDVASDVAFLAMELDLAGHGRLAERFVSRFALASNDYGLYPLLDFYSGYRAWVRGKVACFVAADASTPAEKRRRKEEEARKLFDLAERCTRTRGPAPRLVAVGGVVGSGKSTLADALSLESGFPRVSSDRTRKHLAGLEPTDRGGEEIYTPAFSERVYQEAFRRADEVLASGRGAILDATFPRAKWRQAARDLAVRHGARFLFVECRADAPTLRQRLRERERGPGVSDAREDLLDRFLRDFEPLTDLEADQVVRVDTTRPVGEAVASLLPRLAK